MQLASKKQINRLGIFFFYDKDGIVDDYVRVFLEDLAKSMDNLLVVCNGKLSPEGRQLFSRITDKILVRENIGFDVWAYKEGLEYFGWEELYNYDEVVLLNFTMYGPLYPFAEMFDEMNNRDVDFWGITVHHGYDFDPFGTIKYGYIPEHIQSSFICIRNDMLRSREFKMYWDNMRPVTTYGEAVGFHEAIFTKEFGERGFKWEVYVDTNDLKKHTYYPLMLMPTELVKNRKCPVIKRKCFFNEYNEFLGSTTGEPAVELMKYIEENLDFDTNLIWDNLLRLENMEDIKRRMHFNYVLPAQYKLNPNREKKRKVALMMHIYYSDLIEYCFNYAKSMPEYADIYITTSSEIDKDAIEKKFSELNCNSLKVILIENRGRDVSALLVGCKDYINQYDYVCFAHDKKTKQFEPLTIGESFSYKCFENVLTTEQFVENVINTFDNNPRLGLLTPPPPNHAAFYGVLGTEWGSNYEITRDLVKKLNIDTNINVHKEPISPLGTMFWFRPKAMKTLFDYGWEYTDFPKEPNGTDGTLLHGIERIYGIVVQHEGYHPGWLMADSFARIELTNLHYMLRELNLVLFHNIGHQYGHVQLVHGVRGSLTLKSVVKKKIKEKLKKILPEWAMNILRAIKRRIRRNQVIKN